MFEAHHMPVLSRRLFIRRLAKSAGGTLVLIGISLLIGVLGYHYIEGFDWIDSLLNAAMIAGGMGEIDPLRTTGGKLFASFYAIYSGLFLIAITGFLLAPIIHRVLHKFHRGHGRD